MNIGQFEERKQSHIRHSLDARNQAMGLSGLDLIHLSHEALPDLNLDEISLTSTCLGHSSRTPFYVAGMTAGHSDAVEINHRLARACEKRGWAMGVGSQRRDFENSSKGSSVSVDQWRKLREELPGLVLFANLGISQIIGASIERLQSLVQEIEAQALVIHLNALQECMQPEGTPQFRGAFEAIKSVCENLGLPVVLKETGCGFSKKTLDKLSGIGLSALDVSGLGGTHWGRIEGARASDAGISTQAIAAQTFASWGEPTAQVVMNARNSLKNTEIWASGGVRSGLDAAKLIALGAHRVGYAQPALQAALENNLENWMTQQEFELRVALFCTGNKTPMDLRQSGSIENV